MIERFKAYERFLHWMTAVSFVVLALTGLNLTFGKKVLLLLIGPDAYSIVAAGAKYVHNAMSFPFVIGIIFLFLLWTKNSLPTLRSARDVPRRADI